MNSLQMKSFAVKRSAFDTLFQTLMSKTYEKRKCPAIFENPEIISRPIGGSLPMQKVMDFIPDPAITIKSP